MTVLCTNSGITYADIASAIAGESGNVYLDRKEYIQSGMSAVYANFRSIEHPLGFLYTAADGELVTSGDINSGAGTTASISSSVDGGEITGVRTGALNVLSSNNAKLRRVIVNAGNGSTDGISFNDTLDAEDILIHNCNDGFLSSTVRLNSSIVRCTVVGATRFGFAQGKFTDCVDVNSSNQGYFNEAATSSGMWENDGTGTDTITESPATDIFVDYDGGDYSIKADSSPGLSGAGAFIAEAPSGGISVDDSLTNSISDSNDESINYVGEFLISDSLSNSESTASQDSILFASTVNVSDSVSGSLSNSIGDNVYLVGELVVNDLIVDSSSTASDDSIALAATIIVNDSLINSISLVVNDSIQLSGAFNVIDQLINSASIANNDSVSFSSTVVVGDQSPSSNSVSNNDNVSFVGSVVIGEQLTNSLSLASIDSISFSGEIIITDSAVNSSSFSDNDFIQIGAFEFTVYKETNISSVPKSRNIDSPSLSTNIDG